MRNNVTILGTYMAVAACSIGCQHDGLQITNLSPAAQALAGGEGGWRLATGDPIWSSPKLRYGVVYFGSDEGSIYAVDAKTGELRWRYQTGGPVRSNAAFSSRTVYVASDDGFLYALSAGAGQERWRFDLHDGDIDRRLPDPGPPYTYDFLHSSPVAYEGTIFVGSADHHLYAVDSESGRELWRFATGDRVRASPLVHDDKLYISSWDGHLYCLDAGSGELVWSFDAEGVVQSTAAFCAGNVIVGSRRAKIFAVNAESGSPVWTYTHTDGSWVESSAVCRGNTLYIGSSDALALFAFDARDGRLRWRYDTGGWSWSTPTVAGETIYIGSISAVPYYFPGVELDGRLHAVDRISGEPVWSMPSGATSGFITGGFFASPIARGDRLVVAGLDGVVEVFRLPR